MLPMHAAQLMRPGIRKNVSCTVGDFAIYVYMVHRKIWDQRSINLTLQIS